MRGMVIATHDRLAFQRQTVNVHDHRYNITANNRDFTHDRICPSVFRE